MASSQCESLRQIQKGRSDWKVRVRIIREWRGVTSAGIVFKGYNIILLDNKKCRMHAFIPGALTEKMQRIIQMGKIYIIKNFQVKDYTEKDKFRAVQMDRQIIFTADTKVKELPETDVFIPTNMFDFFEYGDLKGMASQQLYLADVIGIMERNHHCNRVPGKQVNVKFKISDGRKKINVTFWGAFAEDFENEIAKPLEEPIIIIIASGRISTWKEQVDICNYSATTFYLNYEHHSVRNLRERMKDPKFAKQHFQTQKKPIQLCTISQIKTLGDDFAEEEVVCKANMTLVEETTNWKRHICTTCYGETVVQVDNDFCEKCKRFVQEPIKRFHISTVAKDETGGIQIILQDRQVRTLINLNVEDVETEDLSFPKEIKALQGKEYTIVLHITADNIQKRDFNYVATHITHGHKYEEEIMDTPQNIHNPQSSNTETSGTSYHLDDISQIHK